MDLLWLVVPSDVGFAGQRTLLSASEGPHGVCVGPLFPKIYVIIFILRFPLHERRCSKVVNAID
jgi:hypothetical protein